MLLSRAPWRRCETESYSALFLERAWVKGEMVGTRPEALATAGCPIHSRSLRMSGRSDRSASFVGSLILKERTATGAFPPMVYPQPLHLDFAIEERRARTEKERDP